MSLPRQFCWSRFGTEAGETIEQILARKESERRQNNGIFLWGIGNAIGPSIQPLLELQPEPEVIFSPILSKPKAHDVSPLGVVVWGAGMAINGERFELPPFSIVTSRVTDRGELARHYALVCSSDTPLQIAMGGPEIHFGEVTNLRSKNPMGPSQVTAVIERSGRSKSGPKYPVAWRARLIYPYVVRLIEGRLACRIAKGSKSAKLESAASAAAELAAGL